MEPTADEWADERMRDKQPPCESHSPGKVFTPLELQGYSHKRQRILSFVGQNKKKCIIEFTQQFMTEGNWLD